MSNYGGPSKFSKGFSITAKSASTALEASVQLGAWQVLTLTPGMRLAGAALFPEQIHGGNIVTTNELQRSSVRADGVVVEQAGILAGVKTADCVPLVIVSDDKALVLHVSRKSIVRGLLDNSLTYIAPAEINHIYIGPHICNYHFGFKEEGELVRQFRYRYPQAVHFHKGIEYLSLHKALLRAFADWEIHPDKITEDGRCTFEHAELSSMKRKRAEKDEGSIQVLRTVVWRPASDESA